MTLPLSFAREGFLSADKIKRRRLMIGTDGPADSGKTEFALSAPGPGILLALDRGHEALLDNVKPPKARRDDFAFKVIQVPLATSGTQEMFLEYWRKFYEDYKKALANVDAKVIVLDGDSDSWELQRLAEFGKLTQIPSIMYTGVNAARRAMIARAFDSGKTIIATNKITRHYTPAYNADGTPKMDNANPPKPIREWDGTYERQGFNDQDYLWQIQLRHLYDETNKQWGIRITKCKKDMDLAGIELWGDDCNFAGLVQTVYPEVPLKEWGF